MPPSPRLEKLEPERLRAILTVAAEEFAEHGYEAASYNRIIERSGLSKGALYYYFVDKEDLYATVLRDAMQRLVMDAGDMASATDAEGFWRQYEACYVTSLHRFQLEPSAIGLARSLVKALSRGAATGALAELREMSRGWVGGFIAQGQELGAIRTDLPPDLLIQLVMSVEEAIDLWLGERVGKMSPAEIDRTAAMLTRLYRRVTGPELDAPSPRATKPLRRGVKRAKDRAT
jgi:AcrR family transcriptional regulator